MAAVERPPAQPSGQQRWSFPREVPPSRLLSPRGSPTRFPEPRLEVGAAVKDTTAELLEDGAFAVRAHVCEGVRLDPPKLGGFLRREELGLAPVRHVSLPCGTAG